MPVSDVSTMFFVSLPIGTLEEAARIMVYVSLKFSLNPTHPGQYLYIVPKSTGDTVVDIMFNEKNHPTVEYASAHVPHLKSTNQNTPSYLINVKGEKPSTETIQNLVSHELPTNSRAIVYSQ